MYQDILKLRRAGYKVNKLSDYHFQIMRSGDKTVVNLWPTARKILTQYAPGPALKYSDVLKAAEKCFSEVVSRGRKIFVDGGMWDEDHPLVKELYEFRRDAIGYIKRVKTLS